MLRSENRQLAINMIAQFGVFAISLSISFFLTPYIVKKLGIEAYGFWGLSNNIIGYLQLATVSLNSMAGRFISIEYHKGNVEKANQYFSSVFFANCILSVLILLCSVGIIVFLPDIVNISSGLLLDVRLLFALLAANNILLLVFNVYQVSTFIKNRLEISSLRNLGSKFLWLFSIVILLGLFPAKLWFLGCSIMLSSVYLVAVNCQICRKLTPELQVNIRLFDFHSIKELLSTGIWNLITKVGIILHEGCDLLLANWFISAASMGVISLTLMIPNYVRQIFAQLSSSFAPQLTKDFAQNNLMKIQDEISKSIKIFSILVIPVLTVLFVYGDVFFSLWVPSQNAKLLQWLTIAGCSEFVINMPFESFWNVFTVTNKIKGSSIYFLVNSAVVFVIVVCCLSLCDDTITKMYIIVAVRNVFSIIRGLFFLPIYSAHCLQLPWYTFYPRIIKPLSGILFTLALALCMRNIYLPLSWSAFILNSILVAIASLVVGVVLVLNRSEIKFLVLKFKNINHF